jgi:hypothetical protein
LNPNEKIFGFFRIASCFLPSTMLGIKSYFKKNSLSGVRQRDVGCLTDRDLKLHKANSANPRGQNRIREAGLIMLFSKGEMASKTLKNKDTDFSRKNFDSQDCAV